MQIQNELIKIVDEFKSTDIFVKNIPKKKVENAINSYAKKPCQPPNYGQTKLDTQLFLPVLNQTSDEILLAINNVSIHEVVYRYNAQ